MNQCFHCFRVSRMPVFWCHYLNLYAGKAIWCSEMIVQLMVQLVWFYALLSVMENARHSQAAAKGTSHANEKSSKWIKRQKNKRQTNQEQENHKKRQKRNQWNTLNQDNNIQQLHALVFKWWARNPLDSKMNGCPRLHINSSNNNSNDSNKKDNIRTTTTMTTMTTMTTTTATTTTTTTATTTAAATTTTAAEATSAMCTLFCHDTISYNVLVAVCSFELWTPCRKAIRAQQNRRYPWVWTGTVFAFDMALQSNKIRYPKSQIKIALSPSVLPLSLCQFRHYSTDKPNKEERAALAGRPPPFVYAARLRGPVKLHALTSLTSSQSAASLQQWMDMRFATRCRAPEEG